MTQASGFQRFDIHEARRLAELYDLDRYLFNTVSRRLGENKTLDPYDFFAIVIWKSNRTKTRIKAGLAEARKSVGDLMREVSSAATAEAKTELLLSVPGIGLAMASAVLTVCYPSEFTVLDFRAWDTLGHMQVDGLPERYPSDARQYVQYCRACARYAEGLGVSLRELDRALWARSWEADLRDMIL